MGFSNNYFDMLIVPKTKEDHTAANALKNTLNLYLELPFTTSEIYPHIQDVINVPVRNVTDAILRLAKAGILVADKPEKNKDMRYKPIAEFDPQTEYMDMLILHAQTLRGSVQHTRSAGSGGALPEDTKRIHISVDDLPDSNTRLSLLKDLGKYKGCDKSDKGEYLKKTSDSVEELLDCIKGDKELVADVPAVKKSLQRIYGFVVVEISDGGEYGIGILSDEKGEPGIKPLNQNSRKKEFLKGMAGGGKISMCETHSRTNDVLYIPVNRDELLFALRCAGIDREAAEKYLPDATRFIAKTIEMEHQ